MSVSAPPVPKRVWHRVVTKAGEARLRRKVRRGAKLLDRERPGWYTPDKVPLTRLDLRDCNACVLGHLYAEAASDWSSGFSTGVADLALDGNGGHDTFEHGFAVGTIDLRRDGVLRASVLGYEVDGYDIDDAAYAVFQDEWETQIRARRARDAERSKA